MACVTRATRVTSADVQHCRALRAHRAGSVPHDEDISPSARPARRSARGAATPVLRKAPRGDSDAQSPPRPLRRPHSRRARGGADGLTAASAPQRTAGTGSEEPETRESSSPSEDALRVRIRGSGKPSRPRASAAPLRAASRGAALAVPDADELSAEADSPEQGGGGRARTVPSVMWWPRSSEGGAVTRGPSTPRTTKYQTGSRRESVPQRPTRSV